MTDFMWNFIFWSHAVGLCLLPIMCVTVGICVYLSTKGNNG